MDCQRLSNSRFRDLFSLASMLPSSEKSSFEVDELNISVHFDAKTGTATWTKSYLLHKVRDAHEGDDWWWEVTDCPAGGMLHAKSDHVGYGYETYVDDKANLVHWIDLRKKHEIGTRLKVEIKLDTSVHEKEDKLLVMEKVWFFRKLLFRYDLGYSCPINTFKMQFVVSNGVIVQAWPRQLVTPKSNTEVEISKQDGLRARQVFSPLIQIESGSKLRAKAAQLSGSIIGGILIGVAGNYVFAKIPGDHNGSTNSTAEQAVQGSRSTNH